MNAINVAQATNDFFPAPPASTFEDTLILSIVAGIMGLFGGLIGAAEGTAVAGALISGITGGALGVANTALAAPPPGAQNLTTALSQIHDTSNAAYNNFATAIFTTGGVTGSSTTMGSLMEDGALLVEPDFNPETVQIEFQKSIYAQLAVAAWSQTANTVPFITSVPP